MKIDRFSNIDFNSFNDVKNVKNQDINRNSFDSQLDNINTPSTNTSSSPLQNQLTNIAQGTDFNNSISSRVAVDKAARAFVNNLISPELKDKINISNLMSVMSDFAQNDPIMSQKLQRLLVRLA
ncbi:MAG: hypothetical protein HY819_16590 [Acidobacteria bacterium]|nr:hypothetical protein [Acidobacteriota bacterium]